MARRSMREPKPRAKPFADASIALDKMEAAVVYRTVTTDFTAIDAVRCMWPDSVTDLLRAAYPVTKYRGSYHEERLLLPTCGVMASIRFDLSNISMLGPLPGLCEFDTTRGAPIEDAIAQVHTVHANFNMVRKVIDWMNEQCTPGAARFYLPALGALLPLGHPFHNSDGLRYSEPRSTMSQIAPYIRAAGTIIAAGVLADPVHVEIPHTTMGVIVHTGSTVIYPDPDEMEPSQRFMIL